MEGAREEGEELPRRRTSGRECAFSRGGGASGGRVPLLPLPGEGCDGDALAHERASEFLL